MKDKTKDFERLIKFKAEIIRKSSDELIKEINTEKKCKEFMASAIVIFLEELPFYLLDEEINKKILDVISIYRYDTKDILLKELANEVIMYENKLDMISEEKKKMISYNYISTHAKTRNLIFEDVLDFLNTVCRDYDVFNALNKGDISKINDIDFIGSTNYFLLVAPYIYDDEKRYKVTIERAKNIKQEKLKVKKKSNAHFIIAKIKK